MTYGLSWKYIWGKIFKNGPGKICGRQPLKNFPWPVIEYLDSFAMEKREENI